MFSTQDIADIESAGRAATKKSGSFFRRGGEPERPESNPVPMMASGAMFFLENWDDERMEFNRQLHMLGFRNDWFNAGYYWQMSREVEGGRIEVKYVEGDVYVILNSKIK